VKSDLIIKVPEFIFKPNALKLNVTALVNVNVPDTVIILDAVYVPEIIKILSHVPLEDVNVEFAEIRDTRP
jgi:hypothetical protein